MDTTQNQSSQRKLIESLNGCCIEKLTTREQCMVANMYSLKCSLEKNQKWLFFITANSYAKTSTKEEYSLMSDVFVKYMVDQCVISGNRLFAQEFSAGMTPLLDEISAANSIGEVMPLLSSFFDSFCINDEVNTLFFDLPKPYTFSIKLNEAYAKHTNKEEFLEKVIAELLCACTDPIDDQEQRSQEQRSCSDKLNLLKIAVQNNNVNGTTNCLIKVLENNMTKGLVETLNNNDVEDCISSIKFIKDVFSDMFSNNIGSETELMSCIAQNVALAYSISDKNIIDALANDMINLDTKGLTRFQESIQTNERVENENVHVLIAHDDYAQDHSQDIVDNNNIFDSSEHVIIR
jgi:hypothetical protein